MSAIEGSDAASEPTVLQEYPTFELCYLFDDAEDPREITVFATDTDGDPSTRWITVDTTDAVPLEDVR